MMNVQKRCLWLYQKMLWPVDYLLAGTQHFYTGWSVETTLHLAISGIEMSLKYGELALGVFLDIEGAFNNIGMRV